VSDEGQARRYGISKSGLSRLSDPRGNDFEAKSERNPQVGEKNKKYMQTEALTGGIMRRSERALGRAPGVKEEEGRGKRGGNGSPEKITTSACFQKIWPEEVVP